MTPRGRLIAVAGAGVAGLVTALCLNRLGYRVLVLERRDAPSDLGAGIQITPNAAGVLDQLGLLSALSLASLAPEAVRIGSGRSLQPLARVPLGAGMVERYGQPYLVVHRADLMVALRKACAGREGIEIRYGHALTDMAPHARGVTVLTHHGAHFEEHAVVGLVGADGLWSATRRFVVDSRAPRFTGRLAWRALVPADAAPAFLQGAETGLWLGRDAHLVHYPIRQGRVVNVVAIVPWRRSQRPRDGWVRERDPSDRVEAFRNWDPAIEAFMRRDLAWGGWPIHAHGSDFGAWANGTVCLVGDAAHALEPYAAQGAAMAIEDAAVLADCVARARGDLALAFAQFQQRRRDRVRAVRRITRANRRRYHMGGPMAWARDRVLPRLSAATLLRRLDQLYGWTPPLLPEG